MEEKIVIKLYSVTLHINGYWYGVGEKGLTFHQGADHYEFDYVPVTIWTVDQHKVYFFLTSFLYGNPHK